MNLAKILEKVVFKQVSFIRNRKLNSIEAVIINLKKGIHLILDEIMKYTLLY